MNAKLTAMDVADAPRLLIDQRFALPGGTQLSATLYLPAAAVPPPALLCLTVYGADFNHGWAMTNVRAGYAVAVVDVLGRGESAGVAELMNDGSPGADVVAWVAAQPWCDGRVAMFGGSYSGINQWATAQRAPPALVAIAPTVAPMPGLDDLAIGGLPRTYELRWAAHIQGRITRRNLFDDQGFWRALWFDHLASGEPYSALGERLGTPIPFFDTAATHRDDQAHWTRLAGSDDDFARVTVPVLTITGTADDAQRGAVAYHQRFLAAAPAPLAAASALVIGPWNHAGGRAPAKRAGEPVTTDPAQDADPLAWSDALTLAWFDWRLRGGDRPAVIAAPTNVFVAGAERWLHGGSLAALAPEQMVFHLADDSLAAAAPRPAPPRRFVHDPQDFTLARFERDHPGADMFQTLMGSAPDDVAFAAALGAAALAWESAPLAAPLTVVGAPEVVLDLAVDGRDADVAMAIIAALPDGDLLLSADAVRLSRAADRWHDNFWPGRAALTFAHAGLIARRLSAGTRLRLLVFGLTSLSFQANPHLVGPARLAVHGGRLTLPVHPGDRA